MFNVIPPANDFIVHPKALYGIPVEEDELFGTDFELVERFLRDVVRLVDEQSVAARTSDLPRLVGGEELDFASCFESVDIIRFVPSAWNEILLDF